MEKQKFYISFTGACFAICVFILYILLSGCTHVPIEREKIVEQWCAQSENDCYTPDTLPAGRAFSTQVEIDALLTDFCSEYPDKCTELTINLKAFLLPDPMSTQTNDHPDDLLGGIRHDPDDDGKPGREPPDTTPDNDPPDNSGPGFPSPPGPDKDPGCDPPGNPGDKGGRSDHGKGDHSAGKGGGHDQGDHDSRGSNGNGGRGNNGHGRGGGNSGNDRGNGNNKQ